MREQALGGGGGAGKVLGTNTLFFKGGGGSGDSFNSRTELGGQNTVHCGSCLTVMIQTELSPAWAP